MFGDGEADGHESGDSGGVNALRQLVQDWQDADPANTIGVLAHRAGMSRNTIYAATKDGAGMPRQATIKKLARGLGLPEQTVRDAAANAAGYRVEQLDSDSQEYQAWFALLGELPEDRRAELWEIGRLYLRRMKEAP